LVIEANAEFLKRFLESVKSFLTHLPGKPDTSVRSA
jgi:hypothetical protein